jgi:clathrin heavy chain
VNNNASPQVLGTLIDLEVEESYLKQLLFNLRGSCPADELIAEFTKRAKHRVLEEWLEQRVAEGNSAQSIHNALAKIVIDTDKNPQKFLAENKFYDSKTIGKYCEETDSHLAVICYERDFGNCDMELIELTNKNTLYRV